MFNYHAFGLNISSEIQLPGMMEASLDGKTDVEIVLGEVSILPPADGPNYLVDQEDVYLWWDDYGKVKVSGGRKITVDLEDDDENEMIPFLLGPAMAFLLHQKGFLVLHGSAVRIDDGAVAFIGYRGFGKSTTAINLYTKGFPLVADDILAIKFDKEGSPLVYPAYLHVRLSEDSYKNIKDSTDILSPIRTIAGKAFCDASHGFSTEPLRLERIYVLDKGDEIGIYSLDTQDNLMDLIRHSVAHRIFLESDQAEHLTQCAKLINQVKIKGLKVDHHFKNISQLVNLIEEDLSGKL